MDANNFLDHMPDWIAAGFGGIIMYYLKGNRENVNDIRKVIDGHVHELDTRVTNQQYQITETREMVLKMESRYVPREQIDAQFMKVENNGDSQASETRSLIASTAEDIKNNLGQRFNDLTSRVARIENKMDQAAK